MLSAHYLPGPNSCTVSVWLAQSVAGVPLEILNCGDYPGLSRHTLVWPQASSREWSSGKFWGQTVTHWQQRGGKIGHSWVWRGRGRLSRTKYSGAFERPGSDSLLKPPWGPVLSLLKPPWGPVLPALTMALIFAWWNSLSVSGSHNNAK